MATPTQDGTRLESGDFGKSDSSIRPEGYHTDHHGKGTDLTWVTEAKDSNETDTILSKSRKNSENDTTSKPLGHSNIVLESARKKFNVHHFSASGPSKRFNPTNINMQITLPRSDGNNENDGPPRKEMALLWRSRDNRKGRGSISVPVSRSAYPIPRKNSPPITLSLRELCKGIWRMCTTFPYWDMGFWSGSSYTIGSILFVIDGAFAFGPLAYPSTAFPGEAEFAVPLLFFIGTLFYEVGATMAYLEAVNDGSFAGSALRRFLEGHEDVKKEMLDEKLHDFFHHLVPHRDHEVGKKEGEVVDPEAGWRTKDTRARPGSIYPGSVKPAPRRGGVDYGGTEEGEASEYLTWRWWPSWHRLRTHHLFEIGYLACTIQLFGATLYAMAGIVVLPGILSSLVQWQQNAAYWIPQIFASTCFLSAGLLFTFETQEKWYIPKYRDLGWWCGFWAIVGSMGFLLCGALGPASYSSTGAAYQSSLSSMWGSAAYLLSSLCQWYEAVNKHEIVELTGNDNEQQ